MIPFIEKKKIDWYEIKKILQQSEKLNQYANDGPAVCIYASNLSL